MWRRTRRPLRVIRATPGSEPRPLKPNERTLTADSVGRDVNAYAGAEDGPRMKIATFNINNVRKRLPNLLAWLRQAKPDVVCLQELKTTDTEFPAAAIRGAGYEAAWKGQKSWNGVAILGRWARLAHSTA
jgi:endonuclease/exonuclease/phosphatase (EEP) superfamily protein YafD